MFEEGICCHVTFVNPETLDMLQNFTDHSVNMQLWKIQKKSKDHYFSADRRNGSRNLMSLGQDV